MCRIAVFVILTVFFLINIFVSSFQKSNGALKSVYHSKGWSKFRVVRSTLKCISSLPRDSKLRRLEDAILGCGKKGDALGCLVALQEMRRRGLMPSDKALTATIDACTSQGQWEKGIEVFDQAVHSGAELSTKAFISALKACQQGKDAFKLLEIFRQRKRPGQEAFSLAIEVLAQADHQEVLHLLKTADSLHYSLHQNSIEAAVLMCERMKMKNEAKKLKKQLQKDIDSALFQMEIFKKAGDAQSCLVLLKSLTSRGISSIPRHYQITFELLVREEQWTTVLKTYDEIHSELVKSDNQIQYSVLQACKHLGLASKALALLKKQKDGFPLMLYELYLDACISASDFESGVLVLENIGNFKANASQEVYTKLVALCKTCGQFGYISTIENHMKQYCIIPSLQTYKELLACRVAEGNGKEALALFEAILANNFDLDIECTDLTIKALSKEGSWEDALVVFEAAVFRGLEPQSSTYYRLMGACIQGGRPDKCLSIYQDFLETGLPQKSDIFRCAIRAYAALGDGESACRALREMHREEIKIPISVYNMVMEACQKSGMHDLAEEVLHQMSERGIKPDARTYSAAMMASGRAGSLDQAFQYMSLVRQERKRRKKDRSADVISYNRCINACELWGRYEKALKLLDEMNKKGIQPDIISYHSAMVACERGERPDLGLELFQKMQRKGIAPSPATFQTAISCFLQKGDIRGAIQAFNKACHLGCFENWQSDDFSLVDLHGMTVNTAIIAVLCGLGNYLNLYFQPASLSERNYNNWILPDGIYVITGKGKKSVAGQPVLKPAILKMFQTNLQPLLVVKECAENTGRIFVSHQMIENWINDLLTSHDQVILRPGIQNDSFTASRSLPLEAPTLLFEMINKTINVKCIK